MNLFSFGTREDIPSSKQVSQAPHDDLSQHMITEELPFLFKKSLRTGIKSKMRL